MGQLAEMVRAKYPGAYTDMNDAQLEAAVLSKYPQYSDLTVPKPQPPAPTLEERVFDIVRHPFNAISQAADTTSQASSEVGNQITNDIQSTGNLDQVPGQVAGAMGGQHSLQNLKNNTVGQVENAVNAVRNNPQQAIHSAATRAMSLGLEAGIGDELLGGEAGPKPPINNVVRSQYSRPADFLASALRSNARIDVPAEAHIAHDAIAEGLADRGFSARDFNGRNGPAVLKAGIDNAIRIHEARAESVLAPIRGDVVDPDLLKDFPELAKQPEIANKMQAGQPITYNDVDASRVRINKVLRRMNFYAKDPTAQVAADLEAEDAGNQARDLLYGHAQQVTGADLRPLKRTESSLLKLTDLSNSTVNTLVGKEARYATEPLSTKVGARVKGVIGMKANPISAFFSYEKMGESPLNDFNRAMQKSFSGLKPSRANLSTPLPSYNLRLTGEGRVPPATQDLLNFNGADQETAPAPSGNGNSGGNPGRDTAILHQVQSEHPDWNLSQQLQEAAKRTQPERRAGAETTPRKVVFTPEQRKILDANHARALKETQDKLGPLTREEIISGKPVGRAQDILSGTD